MAAKDMAAATKNVLKDAGNLFSEQHMKLFLLLLIQHILRFTP
mgnify:CR=1 FL=1